MSTYFVYQNRGIISWCPTILIGAYLIFLSQPDTLKIQPHYDDQKIEISLVEPPAAPTPKTETEPEPAKNLETKPIEKPEPTQKTETKSIEKPEPVQKPETKTIEKTEPEPAQKTETKPIEKTEPVQKPETKPIEKTEPEPAQKTETKPVEKPKINNVSLETSYKQSIRAAVEAQKRYPTGREASLDRPEGSVEVWLEVTRNGDVLNSGISKKSNNMLLNRAALSSLQNIKKVEQFPENTFDGENQKKFIATLNYTAP